MNDKHRSSRAKTFFILAGICFVCSYLGGAFALGASLLFWPFLIIAGIFLFASFIRNHDKNFQRPEYPDATPVTNTVPFPPPKIWERVEAVYEDGRPVKPPYLQEK